MPTSKDLKRLTRARMQKTGESYTTARAQLLNKKSTQARTAAKAVTADLAALAGMSDEAVKAKTGCTWERWVSHLDKVDAASMAHRDIAAYVHENFDISGWWAQTVTVGYERIKGLREIGQRRGGTYDANKSKTFAVPISKLYRAFSTARNRNRWLPDVKVNVRTSTVNKSVRLTWEDGSSVDAYFTAKGAAKSQVAIQHRNLPKKTDSDKMKKFWGERLAELAEIL